MCGLLCVYGDEATSLSRELIQKLKHRGPDGMGYYDRGNFSMAFSRLAINDIKDGAQPYSWGDFVSIVNGEIYNHVVLNQQYNLNQQSNCDAHIIAPFFSLLQADIIKYLDGFYSGLIYNKKNNKLFSLRDYTGKKNLFLVNSGNHKIITSELKAIPKIDKFQIIPPGCCEIDIQQSRITLLQQHESPATPQGSLEKLVRAAVQKRIPPKGIPFGVFLSGGLDSSIIAKIVTDFSSTARFYLLGNEKNQKDYKYGKDVLEALNIPKANYSIVPLPNKDELPQLIASIVAITESYNPSIISNGLCSYLLARVAHQDGLKVILSGDGADEMFGGYSEVKRYDKKQLLDHLHFTELRRIDLTTMHHSIEVRCPFLDRDIYAHTQNLPDEDFYSSVHGANFNKYILRKSFQHLLPHDIIWRKKTSFDVGSGIREMVVSYLKNKNNDEKDELQKIWRNYFSHKFVNDTRGEDKYFYSYPVFDEAIKTRGGEHKK